jgi:hypothetical protein
MTSDSLLTKAEDTILQKVLRLYGEVIGRYACLWCLTSTVLCLAIAVPGWSTRKGLGGSKEFMNPKSMAMQWSVKGGKTEKHLNIWDEKMEEGTGDDWDKKDHVTMLVGKTEGADIFTKAALQEWLEMDRKWETLRVVVNARTTPPGTFVTVAPWSTSQLSSLFPAAPSPPCSASARKVYQTTLHTRPLTLTFLLRRFRATFLSRPDLFWLIKPMRMLNTS